MSGVVAIGTVLALRKAHAEAARLRVLEEQAVLERAAVHELESAEHRNNALTIWHGAIGKQLAQPAFVDLAAKWLVAREQSLAAAKLDLGIADQRRQRAGNDYAAAQARVMATEAIAGELDHQARKHKEGRQTALLEDLLLARRGR